MNDIEKMIDTGLRATKDNYLSGLASLFTRLKIKPNYITGSGIVMMLIFSVIIAIDLRLSVLFLIGSLLCDSLDGVVARYQHAASDRGKFIDVVTDDFNAFLFAVGIAYAQLVDLLILIPFVYFMLLSRALRVFIHSFEFKSDWLFRPVAGFLHNVVVFSSYLFFCAAAFGIIPITFLGYVLFAGTVTLFADAVHKFFIIINMSKEV